MPLEIVAPAVAGIVIALVVAGQAARRRLARRHPPTGRLIATDGRRVHVVEHGTGPVVVLESGTWSPGEAWEPVMAGLAGSARVLAYDRAGLGWSDPSPHRRTPTVIAEELRATLAAAGIDEPVVLVGHSFGGIVARVFAALHPGLVRGLVLVDAAHEAQFERAPAPLRAMNARMARLMPAMLGVMRPLVAAGLVALRPSMVPASLGPLPPATLASIRACVASRPSVVATMAAETRDLEAGLAEVRALGIDAPGSLGDIPLRVLSHGRAEPLPPALGEGVADAYEATWQELQASLAALSTRSRRTVVAQSGHNIPTEAPDAVVAAVLELVRPEPARAIA